MTDFAALLRALVGERVDFILVGGFAAAVHGAIRTTRDLDIVYSRASENLARLAAALRDHSPYLRGAPPGLPFTWDERTLALGRNFTLTTDIGELDAFGEIVGGDYDSLVADSEEVELLGIRCRVLRLEKLIAVKRAAGRPKDLEAIAELEVLLEERDKT